MADKGDKKEQPPPYPYEKVPDPDEDDLDDLDDVLDEFSATKLEDKPSVPSQPSAFGPGRPPAPAAAADAAASSSGPAIDDDAFAQQLQAGMAELLGELGNNPEMQKQFEDLMKELGDQAAADAHPTAASAASTAGSSAKPAAGATPSPDAAASSKATGDKKEESFQEQIRRTMERMQASGEQADAAAASSGQDDFLAQMLAEMERGGFSGTGEGGEPNDEDFSKMLMGMMEQLTNKEILYEPMKDLDDKFPGWFEKNRETCKKEDLARYEDQQRCVREIVARFERSGYSDEDTADREYIVERMQKMQAAGSPPPDLVGDDGAAREALGELDAGCPTQ